MSVSICRGPSLLAGLLTLSASPGNLRKNLWTGVLRCQGFGVREDNGRDILKKGGGADVTFRWRLVVF